MSCFSAIYNHISLIPNHLRDLQSEVTSRAQRAVRDYNNNEKVQVLAWRVLEAMPWAVTYNSAFPILAVACVTTLTITLVARRSRYPQGEEFGCRVLSWQTEGATLGYLATELYKNGKNFRSKPNQLILSAGKVLILAATTLYFSNILRGHADKIDFEKTQANARRRGSEAKTWYIRHVFTEDQQNTIQPEQVHAIVKGDFAPLRSLALQAIIKELNIKSPITEDNCSHYCKSFYQEMETLRRGWHGLSSDSGFLKMGRMYIIRHATNPHSDTQADRDFEKQDKSEFTDRVYGLLNCLNRIVDNKAEIIPTRGSRPRPNPSFRNDFINAAYRALQICINEKDKYPIRECGESRDEELIGKIYQDCLSKKQLTEEQLLLDYAIYNDSAILTRFAEMFVLHDLLSGSSISRTNKSRVYQNPSQYNLKLMEDVRLRLHTLEDEELLKIERVITSSEHEREALLDPHTNNRMFFILLGEIRDLGRIALQSPDFREMLKRVLKKETENLSREDPDINFIEERYNAHCTTKQPRRVNSHIEYLARAIDFLSGKAYQSEEELAREATETPLSKEKAIMTLIQELRASGPINSDNCSEQVQPMLDHCTHGDSFEAVPGTAGAKQLQAMWWHLGKTKEEVRIARHILIRQLLGKKLNAAQLEFLKDNPAENKRIGLAKSAILYMVECSTYQQDSHEIADARFTPSFGMRSVTPGQNIDRGLSSLCEALKALEDVPEDQKLEELYFDAHFGNETTSIRNLVRIALYKTIDEHEAIPYPDSGPLTLSDPTGLSVSSLATQQSSILMELSTPIENTEEDQVPKDLKNFLLGDSDIRSFASFSKVGIQEATRLKIVNFKKNFDSYINFALQKGNVDIWESLRTFANQASIPRSALFTLSQDLEGGDLEVTPSPIPRPEPTRLASVSLAAKAIEEELGFTELDVAIDYFTLHPLFIPEDQLFQIYLPGYYLLQCLSEGKSPGLQGNLFEMDALQKLRPIYNYPYSNSVNTRALQSRIEQRLKYPSNITPSTPATLSFARLTELEKALLGLRQKLSSESHFEDAYRVQGRPNDVIARAFSNLSEEDRATPYKINTIWEILKSKLPPSIAIADIATPTRIQLMLLEEALQPGNFVLNTLSDEIKTHMDLSDMRHLQTMCQYLDPNEDKKAKALEILRKKLLGVTLEDAEVSFCTQNKGLERRISHLHEYLEYLVGPDNSKIQGLLDTYPALA